MDRVYGLFDWVLSLHNSPTIRSASGAEPIEKLNNCQDLSNESVQLNMPTDSDLCGVFLELGLIHSIEMQLFSGLFSIH